MEDTGWRSEGYITEFKDTFDEIVDSQHDYADMAGSSRKVVIDCGSHRMRVGWSGDTDPRLSFYSVVGKLKGKYEDEGNEIPSAFVGGQACLPNITRLYCRSPFDGNLIIRWDAMESLLDFSFIKLGVTGNNVSHPVLITEPMCNVGYCRSRMSELLFECYGVPAVSFGIDSMFSYYQHCVVNQSMAHCQDGLVVSSGSSFSHVYSVSNRQIDWPSLLRMGVGGETMTDSLFEALSITYPQHRPAITNARCEEIKRNYCYVSMEYDTNLRAFDLDTYQRLEKERRRENGRSGHNLKVIGRKTHPLNMSREEIQELCGQWSGEPHPFETIVYQLPVPERPNSEALTQEEIETRKRKRIEAGLRLKEMQKAKRMETLQKKKDSLAFYRHMLEVREKKPAKFEKMLDKYEFESEKEFAKEIKKLESYIERHEAAPEGPDLEDGEAPRKKSKVSGEENAEENTTEGVVSDLLERNDDDLTEEEKKRKRLQKMMLAQQEYRKKAREEKARRDEIARQRREEEERKQREDDDWRERDFDGWLKALKRRVTTLEDDVERAERALRKSEGRHGRDAMRRMQLMAQQTRAVEDKTDDFGANDDDWKVYDDINQDGESEAQAELDEKRRELEKVRSALSEHEKPSFEREYQLWIGMDRIRTPELLFKPYLAGVQQMGLSECVLTALQRAEPKQRLELVKSIYLTGGPMQMRNVVQRIENDIRSYLPSGTPFNLVAGAHARAERPPCAGVINGFSKYSTGILYRTVHLGCMAGSECLGQLR
mmetsp:Transcript_24036/g.67324  ORF Transcript_24036/g.67324 Transcript_24036/m.67324 type:complete len:770 (+) Transcript_24036:40-2349(+)